MGPVGWGALGGAGLGLLNHWLRPKDNDDRGIGSALLSVLTGAGLGATAGLAYKSLGSNPFDPGPSQDPREAPPTPQATEEFNNAMNDIGRAYGEGAAGNNKKNMTITPVGGTTDQPTPEEAAAIAAAVGHPAGGAHAAVQDGQNAQAAGVTAAPVEATLESTAQQKPTQQQDAQDTTKDQAANKKEQKEIKPFVPSDENTVKYSQYATKHPEKLSTWDDILKEVSPVPPIVPIPGTDKNTFKPGVPFIMTEDVAFKKSPADDALLDTHANFSRTIREKLEVAVDNRWLCVADNKGAVYPIIKVNGGYMGAFLDPVFDPAQNGVFPSMVRETGAFLGRAGNAAVEAATPVVQGAADEVSGSVGTALDFYRQRLGL
jgi:hypothetical protein